MVLLNILFARASGQFIYPLQSNDIAIYATHQLSTMKYAYAIRHPLRVSQPLAELDMQCACMYDASD